MCGIAGTFGSGDEAAVRRMLAALAHRGPDDEHAVHGQDFALGARRLSILDLEHGRQPLSNEDGTVWAAQNGELYNFPALRRELAANGHALRTHCDTEVLPHLWEESGERFVERIDGMFAVAIWDAERRLGVLARDRMGKKPLYYHVADGVLSFASEIKALLTLPYVQRRLDPAALHHYLGLKHVPHPLTIFQGIRALPPAHRLVYQPGGEPRIERYWDVSFADAADVDPADEEAVVDGLLERLRGAVERRLLADVPIGFFLSGGIDSSLTTAIAAELAPERVRTFTLTYAAGATTEGKEEDRRWARWVSERWGTEHHEETIDASGFAEGLRRALTAFDEPFAGVISTYFLSQLIARHVKVAIAGDGADELFGSYLSHRLAGPLERLAAYRRTGDADLIRPFEERLEFLERFEGSEAWEWRSRLLVFDDHEKECLYTPEARAALDGASTLERLRSDFASLSGSDPLDRMLEAEFRTILPDQVLAFVDRLSMAHSLEVRAPYLDTELVRYVAGLPASLKIRNGETKYILKKAALRYFPEEMVFRRKEGFLMPVSQWLPRALEPYIRSTLGPERLAQHGLFRPERVAALVDGLYRGGGDYTHANKVLALLVFQEWYELYLA